VSAEARSRPGPVVLEIGALVVHGVPAREARALAAGLQRELGRLLAQPAARAALAAAPGQRARLDAGTLRPGRTDGAALAHSIYRGVVAPGAPSPPTRGGSKR
jgi:hypothetical protein